MILRPVRPAVAHGPADDEAAGGVHVDLGVARASSTPSACQHGAHHVLHDGGAQLARRATLLGVLRGHDHLLHARRAAVHVAHGHLSLAVGAQVRQRGVLAHGRQALGQAVRQVDGHRHERGRLVAGVAEHHALVARADALVGVVAGQAVLGLPALVDALRDVRALLVNGVEHAARVAVEAELGAVVADVGEHLAHDAGHVHVGLRADLARDHDHARGGHGLAGASHLRRVGRAAVGRHVALGRKLGFLGQDGVQDGVRYLVAHLVGMPLGDGLGREQIRCMRVGHGSPFSSYVHGAPLPREAPGLSPSKVSTPRAGRAESSGKSRLFYARAHSIAGRQRSW